MANLKDYEKLTVKERQNRYFSEDFKRKKVSELDRNLITIAALCREHQVSSAAVYKWIYAYSKMRKKGLKQVIEAKSDSQKILAMREQIKELERIIGEKQVKLDFQEKLITLAEKEYDIDIKKKFSGKHSSGTGSTGNSTQSK
ncbi:MAG: transposase [Marivirga sp.]|nr:transposase [Marivirga sp.]